MEINYRVLADSAVTQVHDLVEDIHAGRVKVTHRDYALNALHLLRDTVLDLNALHILVHDLIGKQKALIDLQIEERIFHGRNHADYHRNASQIRAVVSAGHQQSKRLLNQCAYLTDAFIAHGTRLRSGSFGKQYASLSQVDRTKITDPKSVALIELLEARGQKLEIHNAYRDHYIEHVALRRIGEQSRPATSGSAIIHLQSETIQPVEGHVHQIEPGWVQIQDVSDNGLLINVFYVHARGMFKEHLPPSDETFMGIAPETEIMTRGHFRHTEYHIHAWVQGQHDDDGYAKLRPPGVRKSDFDEVFEDVISYVRDLAICCRSGRLPSEG